MPVFHTHQEPETIIDGNGVSEAGRIPEMSIKRVGQIVDEGDLPDVLTTFGRILDHEGVAHAAKPRLVKLSERGR